MLAKACAERYETVRELRTALEGVRERAWASLSVASASALPAERTPFIGRDTETADLQRMLDRMLTGHGGLALIGGEPGVGKTRLAQELLQAAQQRGCLCLTGRCSDMEGAPPFVPVIEMTEQAARASPQALARGPGRPRAGDRDDGAELAANVRGYPAAIRRAGRAAAAAGVRRLSRVPPAGDTAVAQGRAVRRLALGGRGDVAAPAARGAASRGDAAARGWHLS